MDAAKKAVAIINVICQPKSERRKTLDPPRKSKPPTTNGIIHVTHWAEDFRRGGDEWYRGGGAGTMMHITAVCMCIDISGALHIKHNHAVRHQRAIRWIFITLCGVACGTEFFPTQRASSKSRGVSFLMSRTNERPRKRYRRLRLLFWYHDAVFDSRRKVGEEKRERNSKLVLWTRNSMCGLAHQTLFLTQFNEEKIQRENIRDKKC